MNIENIKNTCIIICVLILVSCSDFLDVNDDPNNPNGNNRDRNDDKIGLGDGKDGDILGDGKDRDGLGDGKDQGLGDGSGDGN